MGERQEVVGPSQSGERPAKLEILDPKSEEPQSIAPSGVEPVGPHLDRSYSVETLHRDQARRSPDSPHELSLADRSSQGQGSLTAPEEQNAMAEPARSHEGSAAR